MLYEHVRRALERVGDLPSVAESTTQLEGAWRRVPLVVGLGGDDIAARTELVNVLCGGAVLAARAHGSAALRVRRGPTTCFRARFHDGTTEEHVEPERRDAEILVASERVSAARSVLADREVALERASSAVPRLVRSRPRGWSIILWPIWWLLAWLARKPIALQTEASAAALVSRGEYDAVTRAHAELATRAGMDHVRYIETLRTLAAKTSVVEVELEVANGPLAERLEVIELGGLPATIDAIVIAEGGALYAPGGLLVGTYVAAIPALPELAAHARAMRLAGRARESVSVASGVLDEQITRAEQEFRDRLAVFEGKRVVDPDAFMAGQLARVRPQIVTSVSVVIEHASVHLGSELAQLGEDWITRIANTTSSETLKDAATHIETTAAASAQRIADETKRLVIGGGSGCAHDLYAELVAELVPLGLPDEGVRRAPALPLIELLPSLANTSIAKLWGATNWLTGLFRSFEARRTEVREKVHAQIEQLRELANDELLDVEPKLHIAIEHVLAPQLAAACERQAAAIGAALAAVQASVAEDRARLAPVAEQRARAHAALRELGEQIHSLEAEFPASAAAAAAAA